ncbi:MAG: hypothetical protein MJ094_02135 [Saccharofermentans sp.]|nr:hypothetical protein [Saccharofermentans sp.]
MSTIETAISITFVFVVLCALILMPISISSRALDDANISIEDVLFEDEFLSSEQLNTFLTGISENYRIIYGSIVEEVTNEE